MPKSEIFSEASRIYVDHFTSSNHAIQETKEAQHTKLDLKSLFSGQIFRPSSILYSFLKKERLTATITHSQIIDLFVARAKILIANPY
jgi:hypothetical protein